MNGNRGINSREVNFFIEWYDKQQEKRKGTYGTCIGTNSGRRVQEEERRWIIFYI